MARIKGWKKTEDDPDQMTWEHESGGGEVFIFRDESGAAQLSAPGINRILPSMNVARRVAVRYMRSHPNG